MRHAPPRRTPHPACLPHGPPPLVRRMRARAASQALHQLARKQLFCGSHNALHGGRTSVAARTSTAGRASAATARGSPRSPGGDNSSSPAA
eukprot:2670990-Prymnesium_polylepis.1